MKQKQESIILIPPHEGVELIETHIPDSSLRLHSSTVPPFIAGSAVNNKVYLKTFRSDTLAGSTLSSNVFI